MLKNLERPLTLKQQALRELREAITLGHLSPGERLVERKLCEQLGVSRTVIRECIRHLESERLIETIPNVGPRVLELDIDEVEQIYALRALLEADAVQSCTLLANTDVVKLLEQRIDAINESLASRDLLLALELTRSFYETIFDVGQKSVSWDLVERLNGRIGRLRVLTLGSKGRSKTGPKNLTNIVKAIKKGDNDGAAEACRAHVNSARKIAIKLLTEEKKQSSQKVKNERFG